MPSAFPSEAIATFQDNQQLIALDMSDVASIPQATTDNVVASFLSGTPAYTGMAVAADQDALGVTIAAGRVYSLGGGYALRDAFEMNLASLINLIPDTTQSQIVLIVARLDTVSETENRTLEDASKKPSNPADLWPTVQQIIRTRLVRTATPDYVPGVIAVTPSPPPYNPLLCLLATVTLNKSGVVVVVQNTAGQITRLDQMAQVVASLAAFQAATQPVLDSLKTSVAAIALQVKSLQSGFNQELALLAARVSALESRATGPATASLKGSDQFVDLSQTDTALTGNNALVYGGLRFPYGGSTETTIAALNPYAGNLSNIARAKGLIMPDAGTLLGATSKFFYPASGQQYSSLPSTLLKMNTLGVYAASFKQRGYGVQRTRFGKGLAPSSTAPLLSGGDPNQIFGIDVGDVVYDASWGDWHTPTMELKRGNGFSRDLTSRDLWTRIIGTATAGGVPAIATSFTAAGAQYLSSITVDLQNKEVGGPLSGATIRCLVTKSANGVPDIFDLIDDVTVPMHGYYTQAIDGGYTEFGFNKPVLVNAGETIHFVFLTTGNYAIRMTPVGQSSPIPATFGPALAIGNTGWVPLTGYVEVAAALRVYDFSAGGNVVTVPLQPFGLTGGIDMIDIAVNAMVPPGTALDYQVLIGQQWVTLADIGTAAHPLSGRLSNLQVQAVFSGTAALMPIIDTTATKVKVSRAAGTLQHDSATRTPAANIATVTETIVIDNWNAAQHTATAKLLSGTGFATAAAPTTTNDVVQPDGSLLRTWVWAGLNLQAHKVEIDGTASDPTNTWVGRQANWSAN